MNVLSLAYKNLKRKKIRTALTVMGVAIAVGVLVSLMGFDRGYQAALTRDIDKMGYQLLVTAKGCPYEAATMMLKGGGGLRYMEEDIVKHIESDTRVDKLTPQLVATEYDPDRLDGQGGFVMYMGISDSYRDLKPWVTFKAGTWFSSLNADEAIMGYEAAELEQRAVGDKIFIPNINKVLTVVGIFDRTGTQDDGVVFLPLQTAQTLFDLPGQLTGIGIKLKDIHTIGEFEEDLYNVPGIQVISMAQVRGTILNLVASARVMANSVALIAIFIALIGVINTILMSVFERTQEIGVMKAIGASRLDVFKLIWMETLIICAAAGIIGNVIALVGSGVVEIILRKVLPYAPSGSLVLITPQFLASAFLGAIVLGILSGIYPAWRAASMIPVEAIRRGE
ncbi:MAG: ABC transporter permease [Candidatus Omnitrophica bacterium]|nr:ABC transporter permease [Candidatus Omnitrophota bacterium]